MFETKITENTQAKAQSSTVTSPIYADLPSISEINNKQKNHYKIINSIMFFGLAIVAVTIFYKALVSLML